MSKTIRSLKTVYHLEGKESTQPTRQSPCWLLNLPGTNEKSTLGKSVSQYKVTLKHPVTPAGNTNKRDDTGAETI